ncbi:MAG: alpha-glucosidase, partial [Bacteroidetes bacterium HGW-Bacteroidetes-23]
MKKFVILFLIAHFVISCSSSEDKKAIVTSPNKAIRVEFQLNAEGKPFYQVFYKTKTIIDTSFFGFDFKNAASFDKNLGIVKTDTSSFNETWQMPWGEQLNVVNHYNELRVELQETIAPKRKLNIVFRIYDDGIGFRYEFPKQPNFDIALITEENTQFNLTEDYKTFWIPGDWDIYEHLYRTTNLSKINALQYANHKDLAQTYIPENAVDTPVTLVGKDGIHLSFHEAALVDYADMTLKVDTVNLNFKSVLVGSENRDYKVERKLPFNTPWRTIQVSDNAGGLIESRMIVNLNEPNKIGDVSWFKPMKYTGVWWEMHLGKSTWDYSGVQDMTSFTTDAKPSGKHGATTENVKKYIDFSAK